MSRNIVCDSCGATRPWERGVLAPDLPSDWHRLISARGDYQEFCSPRCLYKRTQELLVEEPVLEPTSEDMA